MVAAARTARHRRDQRAADLERMAYLTRFDSTHGPFAGTVESRDGSLIVDGAAIDVSHACRAADVDWSALGVDLLVEASGRYRYRHELDEFLAAGCPRVLLSHRQQCRRCGPTIVYGMNHESLGGEERIVSAASCPPMPSFRSSPSSMRAFGIEHALTTTLHSVMNDQPLIDGYHHTDLRMTRSAMQSMIPVDTGLAVGVARLLPRLAGRIEAKAIRVPVPNVSTIDLVVTLSRSAAARRSMPCCGAPPMAASTTISPMSTTPAPRSTSTTAGFRQSSMAARHGSAASGW